MGRWWHTGEAVVGTRAGIVRAGTVPRVGAHRPWDCDGFEHVRGLLWQWDPAQGHPDLKVRWLGEEEIQSGQTVKTEDGHREQMIMVIVISKRKGELTRERERKRVR